MNFRKLCRIACAFLLIFFSQGDALAATIHGTVYEWNSFKPLNNTIIEVNSTPMQYFVATDANYSFNLTPGTYLITANYFDGKTLVYTAQDSVTVSDQGEFVLDLLLFPPNEEELLSQNGSEVSEMNYEDSQPTSRDYENSQTASQQKSENSYLIAAFLAFVIVTLLGVYLLNHFLKRGKKPPEIITGHPGEDGLSGRYTDLKRLEAGNPIKEAEFSEEIEESSEEDQVEDPDDCFEIQAKLPAFSDGEANETPEDRNVNLPDDLKDLLELIRVSGNRITQRELRKKSPYSESKVSLMLSDLEERGLIEKFKRGRGNIIRIPDEHITKQTEEESKQE